MASKSPVILIIPGSFATAVLYDPLANYIRSRGYEAQVLQLVSANDGSVLPPPTLDDDTAHIRAAILSILDDATNPRDVVLALHSYAGGPGSNAVQGLSKVDRARAAVAATSSTMQQKQTGVLGIAYLAAFLLPVGKSNRGYRHEAAEAEANAKAAAEGNSATSEHEEAPTFDVGAPGGYLPALDPAMMPLLFNDFDAEERKRLFGLLTRHSSDCFDGVARYEPWKKDQAEGGFQIVSIIPTEDLIVPTELQRKMFADAKVVAGEQEEDGENVRLRKVEIEGAGHIFTISRVEEVGDEILKLARV